jgi:hypothetical protein
MIGMDVRPTGWMGTDLTEPTPEASWTGPVSRYLHNDDVSRFVRTLRQACDHRRDTIVRVHHDDGGWVEMRCSFVPIDEPADGSVGGSTEEPLDGPIHYRPLS